MILGDLSLMKTSFDLSLESKRTVWQMACTELEVKFFLFLTEGWLAAEQVFHMVLE